MKTLNACMLFAACLALFACQPKAKQTEPESEVFVSSIQKPQEPHATQAPQAWNFCTDGYRIRMRVAPSIDSGIVTTIPLAGEKLIWTGKQIGATKTVEFNGRNRRGSWMEFKYKEYTGWIFDAGVAQYLTQGTNIVNPLYICGLGSVRGMHRRDLESVFGKPTSIETEAPSVDFDRWTSYMSFAHTGFFLGYGYVEEGCKSAEQIQWFESSTISFKELPHVFIQHPEITLRAGTTYDEVVKIFGPSEEGSRSSYQIIMSNGDCGDHYLLHFENGKLISAEYGRDCCTL
jgi:hypothetical protein